MNTTTNATRKTATGNVLPESFPTVTQREYLRQMITIEQSDATLDLVHTMETILKTSYTGAAVLLDQWSEAEAAFAEYHGRAWFEVVTEMEQDDDRHGVDFDKAEAKQESGKNQFPKWSKAEEKEYQEQRKATAKVSFPGLPAHSEIELTNFVAAHPFKMVQGNSYADAFKGACSSRRAGLVWTVWAGRMKNAGMNTSLIAYIVLKVYGMDSRELVAYKR